MKRPTFDELAVRAILRGDDAELQRLNQQVKVAIGSLCPDCGAGPEAIEDNGQGGYLCTACSHQWENE